MKLNQKKIEKLLKKKERKNLKLNGLEKKIEKAQEKLKNPKSYSMLSAQTRLLSKSVKKSLDALSAIHKNNDGNVGAELNHKIFRKLSSKTNQFSYRFSKKGRKQLAHKKLKKFQRKTKRVAHKLNKLDYKLGKTHLKSTLAYQNANKFQKFKMKRELKRKVFNKTTLKEKIVHVGRVLHATPKNIFNRIKSFPKNFKTRLKNLPGTILASLKALPSKIGKSIVDGTIRKIKNIFFWIKASILFIILLFVFAFVGVLIEGVFAPASGVAVTTYTNDPEYIVDFEESWRILELEKEKEIEELEPKYLANGYDEFYLEMDEEFAKTGVSHDPHLVAAYMNAWFGEVEKDTSLALMKMWTREYFKTIYTFEEKPSTRVEEYIVCNIDDEGNEICETHTRVIHIMTIMIHKKNIENEFDENIAAQPKETRNFYEAIRATQGNMPELFATFYNPQSFTSLKLSGKANHYKYISNRGHGSHPNFIPTANGALGHCTFYVYGVLAAQGVEWKGMGNAKEWAKSAYNRGLNVDRTVNVNDVVVFEPGVAGAGIYGHVAVVTKVNSDGSFEISEMNGPTTQGGGLGVINSRTISANDGKKSYFITP